MTGDIRKQLIEALDEAERQAHEARGRIVGGNWDVSRHHRRLAQVVERGALIAENLPNEIAEHIARWNPSTVLRLVERDRRLIERHQPEIGLSGEPGQWCAGCHYTWTDECPELLGTAAFWLGTPEVDR